MAYRDDLEAALARVAALEAELRAGGGSDAEAAAVAELRRDNAALRAELERAATRIADQAAAFDELTKLRAERDRLVERVRVLQTARDAAAHAPPPVPAPPRPAKRPTVWEHNRALPPIGRGEPAGVWCPVCRAAGVEVELVKKLGRFVGHGGDADYDSVACPRCLFTALARRR